MPPTPKRQKTSRVYNELSVSDKLKVLQAVDRHEGYRKISSDFGISKATVGNIVKARDTLEDKAANAENLEQKRPNRKAKFEEINSCSLEWFRRVRMRNLPITGPMIQEKARFFAKSFGAEDFAASNGWLESFINRHSIDLSTLSGESADVDQAAAQQWMESLPVRIGGYQPRTAGRRE